MENTKKSNIQILSLIAVMSAVMCIIGPIVIPIGVVPISLTNFVIYLTVIMLGCKKGTISYLIYMLIGLVGAPVFSGFSGGVGKLLGPTGGYLIGFIFIGLIAGFFADRFKGNIYMYFIGITLSNIVNYIFGSVWLAYQANLSIKAALMTGVVPFIVPDLVKAVIAILIGMIIKKQLVKAHLL